MFVFNSTRFTVFIIGSIFTFTFMNSLSKIANKIINKLAISYVLSTNCNPYDIVFVISFPFLLILVTSFSIGTEKVMSFSVFSPKQVICPSNSSAISIMIK